MADLPHELRIQDVALHLITDGDDIACWSGELPRAEHSLLSLVVEPAAAPSQESLDTAGGIVDAFDELVAKAAEFLVAELASGDHGLLPADLSRLSESPIPFGLPEATVWDDGTWLLRFAEVDLEIAGDLGLAVRFVGTAPVAIEDLEDPDPDADPDLV